MSGSSRQPSALPPKIKHIMRPPIPRPSSAKGQSNISSQHTRAPMGPLSPANSIISRADLSSVPASPASCAGGVKRKERDYDRQEEETNINVVVRCRGRSEREVKENSGIVVCCADGVKGKSIELSMGSSALGNKIYHFDKVFSHAADQAMVYDDVVTPILDEMLQGYNCTIFAYGQTGTGKTYTMSGDMSEVLNIVSDTAGIIPRVLHSLFAKLEADEAESSVKCSFIELYNEELRDLLSLEENAKLKIYEDSQKKGTSATFVQGMEEAHIKTASDGIKLLQKGSHRRQVAATKCNELSSRSHTVFTITVYIKMSAENGEDFVSAGKLNLVDLAGSENIQRSGAENKRAAEAGLINKSLLTLGRVINALVDKSSHIPYRESKLTRLLQDSLGGRTKTCIIATISPAKSNLEETISTLDYAFRAKNIKNKPQVNQMVSKKTLIRDFTLEIEKLKSELIATRSRNGVYLNASAYEEITIESESRRILGEEQKAKIEIMEANLRNKVQELFVLSNNLSSLRKENDSTCAALESTKDILEKTEHVLACTRQTLTEETALRKAHQSTEEKLSTTGEELISTLKQAVTDVGGLRSKIQRKSNVHDINRFKWHESQANVADVTDQVDKKLHSFQLHQEELMSDLSRRIRDFVQAELENHEESRRKLESKVSQLGASEREVIECTSGAKEEMNEVLEEIKVLREDVKQKIGEGLRGLSAAAGRISAGVINELETFHTQLHTSYSMLGRDFKNAFEDLLSQLHKQKVEANELREMNTWAVRKAIQTEADASTRLERCLAEERLEAAADRQQLISKITSLIESAGEVQTSRWESKISGIQRDIATSAASLQSASEKYNHDMDAWSQNEILLIEQATASRDLLKGKLKGDWTTISEHNTAIQTTTKSVHEETIRIVDAQMTNVAVQMEALDDFVSRARSQNELHHETHIELFKGLVSGTKASYRDVGDKYALGDERIRDLDTVVSNKVASLQDSHGVLTASVQRPLLALTDAVKNSTMKEYVPTGETPQKTNYVFPSVLPRTDSRDKIRAGISGPRLSTNSSSSPLVASPTKPPIYTDSPSTDRIPSQLVSSEGEVTKTGIGTTTGLRELDINVTANTISTRHSDPAPSLSSAGDSSKPREELKTADVHARPLKRQATTTEIKLLQKPGWGKGGDLVKLEGRENVCPGGGRRLRSSVQERN